MDLKILARLGALVLLAVALVAAAIELRGDGAPNVAVGDTGRGANDPLAADLARCRDLGAAAAADLGCRDVWAKNRRRFLGPSPAPAPPPARPGTGAPVSQKDQGRIGTGQPSGGAGPGNGDASGEGTE